MKKLERLKVDKIQGGWSGELDEYRAVWQETRDAIIQTHAQLTETTPAAIAADAAYMAASLTYLDAINNVSPENVDPINRLISDAGGPLAYPWERPVIQVPPASDGSSDTGLGTDGALLLVAAGIGLWALTR